jgi:predicted PolB exonuclease-like 3'-5' exonuclease
MRTGYYLAKQAGANRQSAEAARVHPPMLDRPIAAFDIETIPDPDAGRARFALEGTDEEVVRAMIARRLEETEGRSEYPEQPLHRIVTIGVAWLDPESGRFKLGTTGAAAMDERSHLEGFARVLSSCRRAPRLVSWNGGGYDLSVVRYRAMRHGIPMHELYDAEGERRWNNYQNRYHDLHVDLMDVLSSYGASPRVGLGLLSETMGLPSKRFIDGHVYEHVLRGEEARVREYCKLDVLDTLLLFLAWLVHRGELAPARLVDHVTAVREALAGEPLPAWKEIAGALERWPRWAHPEVRSLTG